MTIVAAIRSFDFVAGIVCDFRVLYQFSQNRERL